MNVDEEKLVENLLFQLEELRKTNTKLLIYLRAGWKRYRIYIPMSLGKIEAIRELAGYTFANLVSAKQLYEYYMENYDSRHICICADDGCLSSKKISFIPAEEETFEHEMLIGDIAVAIGAYNPR